MDNRSRCAWASATRDYYAAYHDKEWGVPVHDDQRHFEFLLLEGAQAGLSWDTILRKRAGYRQAFDHFNPALVAEYGTEKIAALCQNAAIVRNRLKIASAVRNAQVFLAIQESFDSFDAYVWRFVGGAPRINAWKTLSEIPVTTQESDALSKDLQQRGMKFVGSTIMYAHMQATGLVMDHTVDCFRYQTLSRITRKDNGMNQSTRQVSIWHNPQCSKSRQALKLLEENGITPQVVRYLETPPSAQELDRVLTALGLEPRQLMRTREPLYRELGLDNLSLSRQELILAMVANPRLIERPVVLSGDRAVLGRPTEKVLDLLA
ncbi:MAG: arsenate reductase (glutaredoxin) [Magnetococcales bacterium]|nr:arsenate reductase (glutaredoxin) [Magnetococcales bacterium]